MQQYANPIDAPVVPLTRSGAKWMQDRLVEEEAHIFTLEQEMAVMALLREEHEETAARYRARLGVAVSLLPPLTEVIGDPEHQLPVEAQACEAAKEQQRRAEHPYGPSTLPDLPQATGHVDVPGEFPSLDLAAAPVRITAPGWTGPAVDEEAGK
jgi:hypothetical protein